MTLLEECLDVLKKYSIIEDKELEEQILSNLKSTFYGKIDFSKYADAHEINFEEIRQLPDESEYYVIWDNAAIPIIKCNIEDILDNIYDVLAVSFDTWLISTDMKRIIEFYHEGSITTAKIIGSLRNVGVVKSICKQVQTAAYQCSNHGISATGGFISHGYSFFRNRVSFVN